jgi:hypothetical protein
MKLQYFSLRGFAKWEHQKLSCARFEIFMEVTTKNAFFWDVTPCGSCKNRRPTVRTEARFEG